MIQAMSVDGGDDRYLDADTCVHKKKDIPTHPVLFWFLLVFLLLLLGESSLFCPKASLRLCRVCRSGLVLLCASSGKFNKRLGWGKRKRKRRRRRRSTRRSERKKAKEKSQVMVSHTHSNTVSRTATTTTVAACVAIYLPIVVRAPSNPPLVRHRPMCCTPRRISLGRLRSREKVEG